MHYVCVPRVITHLFNSQMSRPTMKDRIQIYSGEMIRSCILQKREKRKRESILTENLLHVLQYLNQFLPKEHAIKYIGFDMARVSKK